MKIFGHRSVESFRRELSRNSQLRIACGLSEGKYKYLRKRKHLIPPARVFTGFLNKLKDCKTEIEEIFEGLVCPFFVFKFIIRKFTNKIKFNIRQTRNI